MSAKRLILATVVTTSMWLPPQELRAQIPTINGNNLYTDCAANTSKSTDQWLLAGMCLGYVTAIINALSSGNSINGFKACIPTNADMNQVVDVR